MVYVLWYSIGSALFLITVMAAFFLGKRLPSKANRFYGTMLVCAFIATVFDALAAGLDPYAASLPIWTIYVFNGVFLVSMHACLPLFSLYLLVHTGRIDRIGRLKKALIFLPFACVFALVLSAPLWRGGIFYVDEGHIYRHGPLHMLLYAVSALYMLLSCCQILLYRRLMRREARGGILLGFGLLIVAGAMQITHPAYLLTTSATAIGVAIMYFVLQSPGDNVDSLTDAFNRVAAPTLLRNAFDSCKPFTMVLFSLRTINQLSHSFGTEFGDELLVRFAAYLRKAFPRQPLMHMYYTEFVVLDTSGPTDPARLNAMLRAMPKLWTLDGVEAELRVDVSALSSADYADPMQMMNTMDYLVSEERPSTGDTVFLAGSETRSACALVSEMEAALPAIVQAGGMALSFRPLLRLDGSAIALEAAVCLTDARFCEVDSAQILRAAERTGCIRELALWTLAQICGYDKTVASAYPRLRNFLVPLSMAMCMEDGVSQLIASAVAGAGLTPGRICFIVAESEAVAAFPAVRENIRALRECGFSFLLDEFGAGYSNMRFLCELPLLAVRVDRALLRRAREDARQRALLDAICGVLAQMQLMTVCDGVTDAEDAALLSELRVPIRQGPYYGDFLPAEEATALLLRRS